MTTNLKGFSESDCLYYHQIFWDIHEDKAPLPHKKSGTYFLYLVHAFYSLFLSCKPA